jgi:hypothetical protein
MERLDECYTVYGTGGWESCMVIQERLQDHGLCSCLRWDPEPKPNGSDRVNWRFFYETNLKPAQALNVLGHYVARYKVQLK